MANQDAIRKYYAESGQQSTLDQLNATSGWGAVEADYAKRQTAPTVAATPTTAFSNSSAVGSSGNTNLATQYGSLDRYMAETGKQSQLDQIRATPGGYERANAEFMAGRGAYASSSSTPGSTSLTTQAPLDLTSFYNSLYKDSGISDLETKYSTMEKAFIEAKGSNNDNPYFSEATRAGKEATLTKLFDERTANLKGDIATKKADVETQLNLKLKQLDINSAAATQALNQFNTLLSAGALDNASGEDIANLTRTTGIPSSMIQSAIQASVKAKEKNEEVSTQLITSTADSGEVTVSTINTKTGEIISQQSLGNVGNSQTGSGSKATQTEQVQLIKDDLVNEIRNGLTLADAFRLASSYLDANDILRYYNANSIYGPAKESEDELAKYGVK